MGGASKPRAPAAWLSLRRPMPVRQRSMPHRGTAAPESGGEGEALNGVPPGGGTRGRAACRPARGGGDVWTQLRADATYGVTGPLSDLVEAPQPVGRGQ